MFEHNTNSKGTELVGAPIVLDQLSLNGRMVTGDALFAQKSICELITEKKGGYVFTVKGNQKYLELAIHELFTTPPWRCQIDKYTKTEKSKGKRVTRTVEMSSELNSYAAWPVRSHMFGIVRVQSRTEKKRRSRLLLVLPDSYLNLLRLNN